MIISKEAYDNNLINQGIVIGEKRAIVRCVMNALKLNMSDNEIIDFFEITPDQLEQIKQKYRNRPIR